jgi:hypothetical protein
MSTTHAYRSAPMTPLHHHVPVYDHFHPVIEDERTLCSTPYVGGSFNYDTYLPKPLPTPPPSTHLNVNSRLTPPPTVNFNLPPTMNHHLPSSLNPNLLTPPAQIIDISQLTPANTVPPPQPQLQLVAPTMPSAKKDMHMAKAGTDSALAGIDTPIAGHVGKFLFFNYLPPRRD